MLDPTVDAAWVGTRVPVTSATGLDPRMYADDSVFETERRRVFERAWVCVGTADEVSGGGRLLVRDVGGTSVLVTRDDDGELRGFVNACRHRGTELADSDCEVAGTIRCPYHRWGYALDGRLVATPRFGEIARDHFDPAEHGLVPVRVDTCGVLLFACLSDETPPLETWLGDLPERLAGYQLDGWVTRHQQELEIDANWKLISENFQEYYHLTWVHPELAKVSRVADHYRYQGPGMYCGQTTTPVSSDERDDWLSLPPATGLDASDAVSGRFIAVFPNVLLSILPNHVWLMRLEPMSAGRTREVCTMLLPPDSVVGDAAIEPTRDFWVDVNAEDVGIVERSQRGLARGGVPAGPLAPRFEEPLHRFHRMLADTMTLSSLADLPIPPGDRVGDVDDEWGSGTNPTPPTVELRQRLDLAITPDRSEAR